MIVSFQGSIIPRTGLSDARICECIDAAGERSEGSRAARLEVGGRLSSLERNSERDREDFHRLARAWHIDRQALKGRYYEELQPYLLSRLSWHHKTWELWLEMAWPTTQFLSADSSQLLQLSILRRRAAFKGER